MSDTPEPMRRGTYSVVFTGHGRGGSGGMLGAIYEVHVRVDGPGGDAMYWNARGFVTGEDAAPIITELGPRRDAAEERLYAAMIDTLVGQVRERLGAGELPRHVSLDTQFGASDVERIRRTALGSRPLSIPAQGDELHRHVVS